MGQVIEFLPAWTKRAEQLAEQQQMQQLSETFPFILMESYALVNKPIDLPAMQAAYDWSDELVEQLQNYHARLTIGGGDYIDLYNDISNLD